jgi:ADP-ribose pyrophosphatase YjhB (NUDIX family)
MASAAEMSRGVAGITASALGKPPVVLGKEAASAASGAAVGARVPLLIPSMGASSRTEANETNENASVASAVGGPPGSENGDEPLEIGEAISLEEFKGDCLGRTYCVNKSPEGEYFFDYAVPPEGFDFNDIKYFRVTGATLAEVEAELRRVLGKESNVSSTAGINNNNNNNGGIPPKGQVGGTGVYIVWDDHILVQRRSLTVGSYTGTITTPGGSVDTADKTLKAAALRELREESQLKVNGEELKEDDLDVLDVNKNPAGGKASVSFLVVLKQIDVPLVLGPDSAHANEVMKFDETQDASLFALPHLTTVSPYFLWVRRDKLQDFLFNPGNKKYVEGGDGKSNPFKFTLAKLNARLGPPGPVRLPAINENENENENGGNGNGAATAAASSGAAAAASSSSFGASTTALRTAAALSGTGAGMGGVPTAGRTVGRTLMIPEPAKALPLGSSRAATAASGLGSVGVTSSSSGSDPAALLRKGGKQRTRKNRKDTT